MRQKTSTEPGSYELYFRSLATAGHGLGFPCDADGRVQMDLLSDDARNDYLFARICVGRDFAAPVVKPAAPSRTQAMAANLVAAAQGLQRHTLQPAAV